MLQTNLDKLLFCSNLLCCKLLQVSEYGPNGPFLTSPLEQTLTPGAKLSRRWILSPGVEVIPWGVKFSVRSSMLLNSRGDKFHPWGPSSPLEVKSSGGESCFRNWPSFAIGSFADEGVLGIGLSLLQGLGLVLFKKFWRHQLKIHFLAFENNYL
jgi:hypothetical protein